MTETATVIGNRYPESSAPARWGMTLALAPMQGGHRNASCRLIKTPRQLYQRSARPSPCHTAPGNCWNAGCLAYERRHRHPRHSHFQARRIRANRHHARGAAVRRGARLCHALLATRPRHWMPGLNENLILDASTVFATHEWNAMARLSPCSGKASNADSHAADRAC